MLILLILLIFPSHSRRGSRGGEMSEFSPPFLWAPFFLSFFLSLIFSDIITKIPPPPPPFQNPGSALAFGQYPSEWKLANVIPLFKNDNRQLKVNYHPVSLLASFSKICERVVFFYLYNFLMKIGFFYKFQSGFRPGDSTINQLIFLVHKIYEALEGGKEVRVVFLDISKAFDKVWHAGLYSPRVCARSAFISYLH